MTNIEELENILHTEEKYLNICIGTTITCAIIFAVALYYTFVPTISPIFVFLVPVMSVMFVSMLLFGVVAVPEYQHKVNTIKSQLVAFKISEGISVEEYNKVNGDKQ
jgi:uncharacterized membrane protein